MMYGEQTQEQKDAAQKRAELLNEFKAKKSEYPAAWNDAYAACKADEDFVLGGNQLTPDQARNYGFGVNYRMPNMLKPYINNQANQTLQNDYRATVSPNGGGADVQKARLREQALRGIQRVGGAPEVYNLARRGQLAAGIHYSKVVVDYANPRGREMEYKFEDIQDTYSVYPYPFVQNATFEDMEDFLIREDVPRGAWKKKTGTEWRHGSEKTHPIWSYWRKVTTKTDREFYNIETKEGVLESELEIGADGQPDMSLILRGEDGEPFAREVTEYGWEWYIIDDKGDEVYAEGEWLGQCAPLVACTGEKVIQRTDAAGGTGVKVFYRSLAHDAKEPQMVYTICENIILLQLAKSPYPHYEIADGSIVIKQLGDYRQNATIGDNDILYRQYDEQGNPLNKPNRVSPDGVDAQLIELQQVQLQKIERILGIYDAALGQKTNEKSGVAIRERAKMSNLANYHFEFNFIEYVRQLGYVVLDSMPNYLSVKQTIPMLDNDDKMVMQEINGPDGNGFLPGERYRMVVEVVPDSDTNREAEAEKLLKMMENQYMGPYIMSLPSGPASVLKAMPGKSAQNLSAEAEGKAEDPEKQQMKQQIDAMREQGQQLQAELERVKADKGLEYMKEENRSREAMRKLELEAAKTADNTEIAAYNAETSRMKVDGLPKSPESILTPGGEVETEAVQGVEDVLGELHQHGDGEPGSDLNALG